MREAKNIRAGFTLVELITVLVIIAILGAFIGRQYFDLGEAASKRAANGAVSEGIARFRMAYEEYQLKANGERPTQDAPGFTAIMGYAPGTDVDIGDYVLRYQLGSGDSAEQVEIRAYRNDGFGSADGDVLAAANATWPE